jgi:hypothetical protein
VEIPNMPTTKNSEIKLTGEVLFPYSKNIIVPTYWGSLFSILLTD